MSQREPVDEYFDSLVEQLTTLYEQTRGMKKGDWVYKAPETSITKMLMMLCINLNQRLLDLE